MALVNVHRPDLDRFEATRRITQLLVVSPATAKTHVSRSMVKLHVRDRAKLVALAYQTGRSASR